MIDLPPRPRPERMPPLEAEALNQEQAAAIQELVSGPRGKLQGPFFPMVRSPGFMRRAHRVGEFIRYESILRNDFRELAILVTAVHWAQPVEWAIHAPIAIAADVPEQALTEIADGNEPGSLVEDQKTIVEFCRTLHATQDVPDELYEKTVRLLTEEGVVDLVGLCGYYAMLAMIMNVARTEVR